MTRSSFCATKSGMSELPPRGVRPAILLEQVRNTVPFIWSVEGSPFLDNLKNHTERELSQSEYFLLCLSAHYGTVGSFVPTDVDNQIRFRLWHPAVEAEEIVKMAHLVMEAIPWDPRPVSTRWVLNSAGRGRVLSGHDGEWFSLAVGAYAACRRRDPELSQTVLGSIESELIREKEVLEEFAKREDGIQMLIASTLIAHNLGDLNRVIEMWNLPEEDELVKLAKSDVPWFTLAGKLNKLFMAEENHRHFALRGPKSLRRYAECLLPVGPFFDSWGERVASHPEITVTDIREIVTALVDGWVWLAEKREKLNAPTVGYARAIVGLAEKFKGGISGLAAEVPSSIAKRLRAGPMCNAIAVDRPRFEAQWRKRALNALSNEDWRGTR